MSPEVYCFFQSYDRYGGERNLALIAGLLVRNSAGLEAWLRSLEITVRLDTNRPPRKTLERIYADFKRELQGLPLVQFHRKKSKLTVIYRSEIGTVEEVDPKFKVDYTFFVAAFAELERVLVQLESTLREKHGLHADALIECVRAARSGAPTSQQELEVFEEEENQRRAAERATKSPWELLGVEWEDFHPRARVLLNDPFFWEGANDFSPNGNDTGADLLAYVREDPSACLDPLAFLERLFKRWGMETSIQAALAKSSEQWDEKDKIAAITHDEAATALPFALIKIYNHTSLVAAELALQAVRRQRAAGPLRGWNESAEQTEASLKIEAKLCEFLAG